MTPSSTTVTAPWAALLVAAVLGVVASSSVAGCASSGPAATDSLAALSPIDSLRAENQRLRETQAVLRDSLRFREGIETGRYYRQQRALRDRIARTRYDLTRFREGGRTVEVIGADALFAPASAQLTPAGHTRLDTLAARLRRLYPERRLRVEGHADGAALSAELKDTYPSNWELSALRAAAVVRYLTGEAGLASERFALAAYADTRPIASNATAAGRRQNRRVRIAVLPSDRIHAGSDGENW